MSLHPASHTPKPGLLRCGLRCKYKTSFLIMQTLLKVSINVSPNLPTAKGLQSGSTKPTKRDFLAYLTTVQSVTSILAFSWD